MTPCDDPLSQNCVALQAMSDGLREDSRQAISHGGFNVVAPLLSLLMSRNDMKPQPVAKLFAVPKNWGMYVSPDAVH
jgi:hypothetical protein